MTPTNGTLAAAGSATTARRWRAPVRLRMAGRRETSNREGEPDWERIETALAVWPRVRKAGQLTPHRAARDPNWHEWMSELERQQLLAMTLTDLWAFGAVMEAETLLVESLAAICDEPDVAAALEQWRPPRWDR